MNRKKSSRDRFPISVSSFIDVSLLNRNLRFRGQSSVDARERPGFEWHAYKFSCYNLHWEWQNKAFSSWFALNCCERDIENLNDQTPAIIQAWLCEVISFSRKLWFHSLDTRSSDMQGRSSKWTQFIAKGGAVNSLSSGIFKLRDLYDLILVSSCHSKANKPHVLLLELN